MTEIALETQIRQLSQKFAALFLGVKIFLLLFLFLCAICDILATLSISTFQQIFADALPGKPLPSLTLFVLMLKPYLFCLALLWIGVGIFAATIRQNVVLSISLICTAMIAILIQSTVIIIAMQLPMIGLYTGMSQP